jgi:hypothetical protein
MPPVRRRMEWTDYAHTPWEAAPVDSLWDLASLQAYAAGDLCRLHDGLAVSSSVCPAAVLQCYHLQCAHVLHVS